MTLISALLLLVLAEPNSASSYTVNTIPCKYVGVGKGAIVRSHKDASGRECVFESFSNGASRLYTWSYNQKTGDEVKRDLVLEYNCGVSEVVESRDVDNTVTKTAFMVDTLPEGALYNELYYKRCPNR